MSNTPDWADEAAERLAFGELFSAAQAYAMQRQSMALYDAATVEKRAAKAKQVQSIAAALRAAYQRGVTDEREACARVAKARSEIYAKKASRWSHFNAMREACELIEEEIRSRTQDTPT